MKKKIFIVIVIGLVLGIFLIATKPTKDSTVNKFVVEKVTIEDHQYLKIIDNNCISFVHDPECDLCSIENL